LEGHEPISPDKNILLVKEFLGHASLDNTLLYIQMEQALFGAGSDDEFIVNAPPTKKKQRSCYQSALSTSARRMIYCTFENANKSEHGRKLSGVSQKQGGVALISV
jgi:hypothetical protein